MFTGTKQRVEFTSEHVHEMPTEPKINDLDQSEQVSEQPQKRKASSEPEELNKAKVRRVLDFDVVSPPTSPNTEMSLPPTPRDPFKQGTTPDNANDSSHPYNPANPSPIYEGPSPTPSIPFKVLWKLGPQYSNRRSNYMRETF